ncbi:calcium-binding protein CML37-like [Magnolia sinica]|uniref:calcium-binding protein CML37-like n=1 Tax=Magnolia sinica TaxID=86752 RepID=UPI00265AE21F|nr:calcium-binding protein CML37-like [Magnolia sinica]
MLKHTPKNPDSVLTFFKSHGFSKTHIKSLIATTPKLFSANPESISRPKIQNFKDKGLSESDVVALIVSNPHSLTPSLIHMHKTGVVFRYLDENGDGKISAAELGSYMRTIGEDLSVEDSEAVVESINSDGDGMLGFEDFVRLIEV